jgi:hypothetical protein
LEGELLGAAACYRRVLQIDPKHAEAHCNLGHVLRDAGQTEAALEAMRKGHELGSRRAGWPHPSPRWVEDLEQLAEGERRRVADIVRGELLPADAGERAAFARLCHAHGHNATAARLCQEGFDDLGPTGRYLAACAAALAGTGQGREAATLPEPERARWREQSLAWLQAELAMLTRRLERDPKRWRGAVEKAVRQWREDSRLAAVRDEAPLARLPAAEQPAWRRLWQDVAALAGSGQGEEAAPAP